MQVLQLLVVFDWREEAVLHPIYSPPLVPAFLFFMYFFVNDVLLIGGIVKLGTCEFEVIELFIAELAGEDFELVRDISNLVSDEAEQLVVHVTLLEDLNEPIVVQPEEH